MGARRTGSSHEGETPASSRERLLAAAKELLYREGIGVVNVDRLAAAAGVSKPTLYALFGSKEKLVQEALERRRLDRQRQIAERLDALADPADRLRSMLDLHVNAGIDRDFRGCPLVAAALELPGSPEVRETAAAFKSFLEGRMASDARAAGYRQPVHLAAGLLLLIEGAIVLAYVRGETSGPDLLRAWDALLGAHRGRAPASRRGRGRATRRRAR
jgi:AcrR family transcriptional regulator